MQKEQFSLTDDIVKFLQEKRNDCLSLAESCFQEAIQCEVDGEEEEWLVHYMLGKIAEKRQTDPQEFLEHYKKAAYYLHEDEAKYPKKIAYHNPPDLSLEALEVRFDVIDVVIIYSAFTQDYHTIQNKTVRI